MDIDKISFPPRLLDILEALSDAHFVAIDFEFSGVASKPATRRKQTLQERYLETKEAAEKYQILQVGLTCAIQDRVKQAYILQSYNIPLSPIFDEDLDLERQFSFQSGAVEFLIKNYFNFNIPFEDGVPYLSRNEERLAKDKFKARSKKGRFEDIEIADEDTLTLAYLDKVRKEIREWMNDFGGDDSVEILSRTEPSKDCEHGGDLTAFDKRLIHQLVRNEYPSLITISRHQSILIKTMDEEREHRFLKDKYKRFKQKIYAQTGFRWIIDALVGTSLGHVDLTWFARDPETGSPRYYDTIAFEARFNRASGALKRKRPVLVGHNCFTDLIYLYSSFIATLPETVEEFMLRVHELFPMVVDTKYLFTHNCGNLNPASSLDAIEEGLRNEESPRIEMQEGYTKYVDEEMYHEAGYDSFLTARVMILLSSQLERKGSYLPDDSAPKPSPKSPKNKHKDSAILQTNATSPSKGVSPTTAPPTVGISSSDASQLQNKQQPSPAKVTSRFATKTLFEALASTGDDEDNNDEEDQDRGSAVVGSSFALDPSARPFPITGSGNHAAVSEETTAERVEFMPPFNSDFWRVYANRLRVFGTVEGMLDLDPDRAA